jgi:hypothetical protein
MVKDMSISKRINLNIQERLVELLLARGPMHVCVSVCLHMCVLCYAPKHVYAERQRASARKHVERRKGGERSGYTVLFSVVQCSRVVRLHPSQARDGVLCATPARAMQTPASIPRHQRLEMKCLPASADRTAKRLFADEEDDEVRRHRVLAFHSVCE